MQFYRQFSEVCAGAPMATFFSRLFSDTSRHLRQLEDLYEEHFLTED
jgi:rubrerythrin